MDRIDGIIVMSVRTIFEFQRERVEVTREVEVKRRVKEFRKRPVYPVILSKKRVSRKNLCLKSESVLNRSDRRE